MFTTQCTHKLIHTDNDTFNTNEWTTYLKTNNQYFSFCSVGAHHQNHVVEHGNRTDVELICTNNLRSPLHVAQWNYI